MLDLLNMDARLVDLILILVVLEAVFLGVFRRVTGRGPRLGRVLPTLAAGAALLTALRLAMGQAALAWILAALACALVAHIVDLVER